MRTRLIIKQVLVIFYLFIKYFFYYVVISYLIFSFLFLVLALGIYGLVGRTLASAELKSFFFKCLVKMASTAVLY